MRKAVGNKPAGPGRRHVRAIIGVAAVVVLLLIGWGGYALFRLTVVQQAEIKWEEAIGKEADRSRSEARKAEEAEQQRVAAVKGEQERRARAEAEAEAKRGSKNSAKPGLPPILSVPSGGGGGGVAVGGAVKGSTITVNPNSGGDTQPQASLPEFPWPPPTASASYVLPTSFFENRRTIGEVVTAIISALERNGYVERSFFRIAAGGVALVTRLERIRDDGSSFVEPQRWTAASQGNSLAEFLRGLFFVDPGHYRVIVFILSDLPFSQSSQVVTRDAARRWLHSGANILTPEIAKESFGDGHCTVLVYEFASDGRAVRVVESSRLTGKEHLTKAGLLSLLENRLTFTRCAVLSKKVFISYRREDTADAAGRVYDRLSRLLSKPNVFFDVSTIGGGEDFEEKIVSAIGRSDAALIFIGREWLAPVQPTGNARIWEPDDYVRAEVRAALAQRIFRVAGACCRRSMPKPEQLPEDVRAITTKNALPLRHESFDDDTETIVAGLLGRPARERSWENKGTRWSKTAYAVGGAIAASAIILIGALAHSSIFDRPISASIGEPATVLVVTISLLLAFGWVCVTRPETGIALIVDCTVGTLNTCPLWVKSGHLQCNKSCPLYTQ